MKYIKRYQVNIDGAINKGVVLPNPFEVIVVSAKVCTDQDNTDPENPVDDFRQDMQIRTYADEDYAQALSNDAVKNKDSILLGSPNPPTSGVKTLVKNQMIALLDAAYGAENYTDMNP